MIFHSRIYDDLILDETIFLKKNVSEYNTKFIKNYGGLFNIIKFFKNDYEIYFYGKIDIKLKKKISLKHKIHLKNFENIKAVILKLDNFKSRLSFIQNNYDFNISMISDYRLKSAESLFYLESVPIKISKIKKYPLISIYNGGKDLIPKSIFLNNLHLTDVLITSSDSYLNLLNYYINQTKLISKIKLIIVHNSKNYKVFFKSKLIRFENKYYDKNLKDHSIGLGDLFSYFLIKQLECSKIECIKDIQNDIDYASRQTLNKIK